MWKVLMVMFCLSTTASAGEAWYKNNPDQRPSMTLEGGWQLLNGHNNFRRLEQEVTGTGGGGSIMFKMPTSDNMTIALGGSFETNTITNEGDLVFDKSSSKLNRISMTVSATFYFE